MKHILKYFLSAITLMMVITACEKKVDDLPFYNKGTSSVLSSSSANIAPTATDSLNTIVNFSWTDPKYATDSATVKYTLQIDKAGNNFSNPYTEALTAKLSKSYIAKDFNAILLGLGIEFNTSTDLDVRVISSYANNNDRLTSNNLSIKATAYKIPPKVAVPPALYIVGDFNGWNNNAGLDIKYKFTQIGETSFAGIFLFPGGSNYFKLIQELGVWSSQFHMVTGGTAESGEFIQEDADPAFSAPIDAGFHKIIVDFQKGTYTVTKFDQQHGVPDELFIVGGATPGSWGNPVPVPSQQFTRKSSTQFELTLALTGGEKFLFLPTNGDWGRKFGVVDATAPNLDGGGTFKPEGQDTPAPSTSGTYKISVDFIDNSYKFTQ